MTYYLSKAILLAYRAPTTCAVVILTATLLPVWLLTMDGGVLSWVGM